MDVQRQLVVVLSVVVLSVLTPDGTLQSLGQAGVTSFLVLFLRTFML